MCKLIYLEVFLFLSLLFFDEFGLGPGVEAAAKKDCSKALKSCLPSSKGECGVDMKPYKCAAHRDCEGVEKLCVGVCTTPDCAKAKKKYDDDKKKGAVPKVRILKLTAAITKFDVSSSIKIEGDLGTITELKQAGKVFTYKNNGATLQTPTHSWSPGIFENDRIFIKKAFGGIPKTMYVVPPVGLQVGFTEDLKVALHNALHPGEEAPSVLADTSQEYEMFQKDIDSLIKINYSGNSTKLKDSCPENDIPKNRTFHETITLPPCTEYELKTFLNATRNFPVNYSLLIEIIGEEISDPLVPVPLTAEELITELKTFPDLEFVEGKDANKILAKGNGSMILDYVWGIVKQGKSSRVDGCLDETQLNAVTRSNISFFNNTYHKGRLFSANFTGSCQTLPYYAKGKTESIRTDACVILFPNESCDMVDDSNENIGFVLKVNPGKGGFLPLYANVAKSFHLCETYKDNDGHNWKQSHIEFFDNISEGWEPLLETELSRKCRNVPEFARGRISSVSTHQCITFFSEENCQDSNNFTVRPYSAMRLENHFNRKAMSFKSCLEIGGKEDADNNDLDSHGRVYLYEDNDNKHLIFDDVIKHSCTTINKRIWGQISSVQTDICVILYSLPYCQGYSRTVEKGTAVLDDFFDNMMSSFVACKDEKAAAAAAAAVDGRSVTPSLPSPTPSPSSPPPPPPPSYQHTKQHNPNAPPSTTAPPPPPPPPPVTPPPPTKATTTEIPPELQAFTQESDLNSESDPSAPPTPRPIFVRKNVMKGQKRKEMEQQDKKEESTGNSEEGPRDSGAPPGPRPTSATPGKGKLMFRGGGVKRSIGESSKRR